MSTAIAERQEAALPAMFQRVESNHRQIPSIYLQQGLSTLVQDGITRPGDVIAGLGSDDPEPKWLIGGETDATEFTGYILNRRISWARFLKGGEMEWLDEAEFAAAQAAGDRDVWTTFHYHLAVPEADDVVPMRLMLSKTAGTKPAKRINFFIDRSMAEGDMNPVPIKFTVTKLVGRQSKQAYFAFQVAKATSDKKGLAAAKTMQDLLLTASTAEDRAPDPNGQPDI